MCLTNTIRHLCMLGVNKIFLLYFHDAYFQFTTRSFASPVRQTGNKGRVWTSRCRAWRRFRWGRRTLTRAPSTSSRSWAWSTTGAPTWRCEPSRTTNSPEFLSWYQSPCAVPTTAVENGNIGNFLHSILQFANHPQWRKTKFLQSIVHRFNFICLFSFYGVTNSSNTCFLLFVCCLYKIF